jgi:thiopurine S-methyltransferase
MSHEDWRQRWTEGRIAFHEGRPNAFLEKHIERLGKAQRVLVPLCGKAMDLMFLASQGHQVTGVELVEEAVKAFFSEHQLVPTVTVRGPFRAYACGEITLLSGDFFATTPGILDHPTALFDRAAIIALPESLRREYVKHLRLLLPKESPGLVVTVEYPQAEMSGPPYSVPEAELRAHYSELTLDLIDEAKAEGVRLSEFGKRARERCFSVRF